MGGGHRPSIVFILSLSYLSRSALLLLLLLPSSPRHRHLQRGRSDPRDGAGTESAAFWEERRGGLGVEVFFEKGKKRKSEGFHGRDFFSLFARPESELVRANDAPTSTLRHPKKRHNASRRALPQAPPPGRAPGPP